MGVAREECGLLTPLPPPQIFFRTTLVILKKRGGGTLRGLSFPNVDTVRVTSAKKINTGMNASNLFALCLCKWDMKKRENTRTRKFYKPNIIPVISLSSTVGQDGLLHTPGLYLRLFMPA